MRVFFLVTLLTACSGVSLNSEENTNVNAKDTTTTSVMVHSASEGFSFLPYAGDVIETYNSISALDDNESTQEAPPASLEVAAKENKQNSNHDSSQKVEAHGDRDDFDEYVVDEIKQDNKDKNVESALLKKKDTQADVAAELAAIEANGEMEKFQKATEQARLETVALEKDNAQHEFDSLISASVVA